MIRLDHLCKRFEPSDRDAVHDLSLHVHAGEFLVLLGESGCGKTTTLKMINRLIEPTSGNVFVNERNTKCLDPVRLRRMIGYVFQGIGLFPHMNVAENVGIVPKLLGQRRPDVAQRVDELLELVELPPREYRARLPSDLSGGQQQRIGVARALAAKPDIMLLDEPFGALDPQTRETLQDAYRSIHDDLSLTTVMVTHDMTEALLLADRIAVMRAGELLQVGPPVDLIAAPVNEYIRDLMYRPGTQARRVERLMQQAGAT